MGIALSGRWVICLCVRWSARMKATGFVDDPGLIGAWVKVTRALTFDALRRDAARGEKPARSPGLFDRLDAWLWRQAQREHEAYLAGARDIYELEARIRHLERCTGSPLV
jgi:hypothetical protein